MHLITTRLMMGEYLATAVSGRCVYLLLHKKIDAALISDLCVKPGGDLPRVA